jgi:ferredoxin-NADP reductase
LHLHPADKYLLISAGSGITPMMSMARWIEDDARLCDVAFINCARRPADLIFRGELERMAAGPHKFELAFVVEATDRHQPWSGFRGRLTKEVLEQVAPDFFEREVFCCGPAPFMKTARELLASAGFDLKRYHEESFQPTPVEEPATAVAAPAGSVVFTFSGVEASGEAGETILKIARGAGLNIPTGCTMGLCGTCKVKKLSGETLMNHQGGIRDEDIAAGFVLACCTQPLGRVEIAV